MDASTRHDALRINRIGLFVLTLAATQVGCREAGPTLHPVVGKVTLDGAPASEGGVVYQDVETGLKRFAGSIWSDGAYSVGRKHAEGVPPGRYKVTVIVTETPKGAGQLPVATTISNKKFSDPATTPFEIEVKDGAPTGVYDLAVTR